MGYWEKNESLSTAHIHAVSCDGRGINVLLPAYLKEKNTIGRLTTGSFFKEELLFKLFFELKSGKRLFLMLGFSDSVDSVCNI